MRWAILWLVIIGIVLLPFVFFEQQFNEFAERLTASDASRWLVAGTIFGLLALDVFLPVPSSLVSTASGVLLGFGVGAAVIWLGMMTGCGVGYAFGWKGAAAARRLVGDDGIERAAKLASRYGDLTIVLCRPVPILAEASVVFAGLVGAPLARFVRLTALSNLGIALGYAAFGALSLDINSFLFAFLGAMLIPGLFLLISRMTFWR
jgi:uncharacterized membrane protein YdjX (TVP38/TMEM64 family)